jgi:aspartate racemase
MKSKKKLGILGGMGSHAAVWLFQRIITLSSADKDQDYLEIVLHNNTAIPDRTRSIVYGEASPLEELKRSIQIFNDTEVEVAVLACMTAHFYYKNLAEIFHGKIMNPIDHIIEEFSSNRDFSGIKTVGVIGSTGLIKSKLIHNRLAEIGIKVVTLNDYEQEEYFMKPLYNPKGIKTGVIDDHIRSMFFKQEKILTDSGAELIIGACSEVPLIMDKCVKVPFIDTFQLLAKKVVQYCYSEN